MPLHVQPLERLAVDGRRLGAVAGHHERGEEGQQDTRQLRMLRGLVGLGVVEAVVRLEGVAEGEVRGHARGAVVLVVQRGLVGAGQGVLHPAVTALAGKAQAETGDTGLRQVQRELVGLRAERAETGGDGTTPFARGLAGDEIDGTGERVAAIERALRATQHLDALEIDHVEHGTLRLAEIHAVQVHADGRVPEERGVVLHAAADGDLGRGGVARRARHGEVRGQIVQRLDVAQTALFHGIRLEGGDGDGHVLQALAALLGGDDDFVDVVSLGGHCRGRVQGGRDRSCKHEVAGVEGTGHGKASGFGKMRSN